MKQYIIISILLSITLINADISLQRLEQNLNIVSDYDKIDIYNYLCTEYWLKDLDRSILYAEKAFELSKKFADQEKEIESLENLATSYGLRKNYSEAKKFYSLLLKKNEKFQNIKIETNALINLGFIEDQLNNSNEAIKYYTKLLKIYQNSNDNEKLAKINKKIADIHKKEGNNETSLIYLINSLKFEENTLTEIVKDDYLKLSDLYANLGEEQKALEYYKLFSAINDSLKNKKITQQINEMTKNIIQKENNMKAEKIKIENEMKHLSKQETNLKKIITDTKIEYQKKEKVLESLKKEKEHKELEIYNQNLKIKNIELELTNKNYLLESQNQQKKYFIIIILIAILFAIIHIYLYQMKRKDNFLLSNANESIKLKNEELVKLNITLNEIARTDPLTQLSNRRDTLEKIGYEKTRYERTHNPFMIIICDIDDFKKVNDTYGHDFGDFVLKKLSKIMLETLRKQDIVGRWGGEEFLIMLPETNMKGGFVAAEKLRKTIEKEIFNYKENKITITITLGLKLFNKLLKIPEIISLADEALYYGKRTGKNKVVVYEKIKLET